VPARRRGADCARSARQEIKLALRQYHVDVHIEDGFARPRIDQTYFNTTWERLEAPSTSRCPRRVAVPSCHVRRGRQPVQAHEGGMAERKHAADVYETIRYQRRDPALLEWLDGTTFKMRVFPLEAKQEKRLVLSYTQKLPRFTAPPDIASPAGSICRWCASGRSMPASAMPAA